MPPETVASAALNPESIMAIKSVMVTRILLGGCMISLLLGLLTGDAWLATKLELPYRGVLFSLAVSAIAAMGTWELLNLAKSMGRTIPQNRRLDPICQQILRTLLPSMS